MMRLFGNARFLLQDIIFRKRTLWCIGLFLLFGIMSTLYLHVPSQLKRLPPVSSANISKTLPLPTSSTTQTTTKPLHGDDEVNTTCTFNHTCNSWFEEEFEENLKIVAHYPIAKQAEFPPSGIPNITVTSFPVIVTGASSKFFDISQGLLKSIYEKILPKYDDVKVLYYDMGLGASDVERLGKYCNICTVRKFEFRNYPKHVSNMYTYAWKPLIIKDALHEYNWVWWMDSSARIITSDLDPALEYSRKFSIWYYPYDSSLSIAKYTDIGMIQFLGEDICKFRYFGEIEAGFVLYHFDDVTKTVVDVWNACALNSSCIAPAGSQLTCNAKAIKDGKCHRYDQSALSIILRRLFHTCKDNPQVERPREVYEIHRGERVSFFPTK